MATRLMMAFRLIQLSALLTTFGGAAVAQPGEVVVPDATGTGYVLFAPQSSTNSYLIDKSGSVVHVWAARNPPAYSVYLMPKGGLLRAESITNDSTC